MTRLTKFKNFIRNTSHRTYGAMGVFNNLYSFSQNIYQFLRNALSIVFSGVGFLGVSTAGRSSGGIIDVTNIPFAGRFMGLVLFATAIGWLFGLIVSNLSKAQSTELGFVSYIFAIICGGFMVLVADWLALGGYDRDFPELQILCFIGLCLALWVANYQFQNRVDGGTVGVISVRARSLMVFAGTSLIVLGLSIMGR